ncbi:MAG: M14-type cytosolic carboxypeptidase [Actinomycetota bacterium]
MPQIKAIRTRITVAGAVLATLWLAAVAGAQAPPPILINTNFEGASLGKVEKLDVARFRLHVPGQYDERGRNRQTTWFYFRMERVKGRDLHLTLTDLVGEYNDKPGALPAGPDIVPVYSADGRNWRHFPGIEWDAEAKETTIKFRPESDTLWVAHIPPYTPRDLARLLADVEPSPHARIEVIGKTVQGRDLHLVTVTDFETPDAAKKTVWLQARQHAWEAGTSQVLEGALRYITSDADPARELRRKVVFKIQPMGDPDGCANGKVRFNANGFDVNRHWNEVDLRSKEHLARMPEIWYVKKALYAQADSGRPIDLMLNMHNTETAEYIDTLADDPASRALVERFLKGLVDRTTFDPSRPPSFGAGAGTTNSVYAERKIPAVLMELRIGTSKKLGRRPTVEDRYVFGRQVIQELAAAVLP